MYSRFINVFACSALFIVALSSCAAENLATNDSSNAPDSRAKICGITIPIIEGVVVEISPLPESFAYNRVNQERYDACPYEVSMVFEAVSMQLDFSAGVTTQLVKQAKSTGKPLYLGAWRLKNSIWEIDRSVFSAIPEIPLEEEVNIDGGFLLSGIASRMSIQGSRAQDVCLNFALIGANGWAGGMTCTSSADDLLRFRKRLVTASFKLD